MLVLSENTTLLTLCWGFWHKTYIFGKKVVDLQPFMDDSRGGTNWYCEPNTRVTMELRQALVEIFGTFRHKNCRRVNLSGVPFDGLMCNQCVSIPKERDFRMRVYRQTQSAICRGLRDTGLGRRLDYMTNSEILNIARTKTILV